MERAEILIVDDEESVHTVLRPYLQEMGVNAVSAANAADALAMLENRHELSIVLTDVRLPGKSGLDLLHDIKQRNPELHVIVMTAYSDKSTAIQALRLGADDFLEKPLRLEELARILERIRDRDKVAGMTRRWNSVVESLPMGILWCEPDGRLVGATPGALRLLQIPLSSVLGKQIHKHAGFEKSARLFDSTASSAVSVEIERANGWLHFHGVLTDTEGAPQSRMIVVTDVTEQRTLQQEMTQLTAEFERRVEARTNELAGELDFTKRLLDSVGILVAFLDRSGTLLRFNKFGEELTGLSKNTAERLFAEIAADSRAPLYKIFSPNMVDDVTGFVAELPIRADYRPLLAWSTRQLRERNGNGGKLIVAVDITEQKQLENKLQIYNQQLQHIVESRSKELRLKDAQLIHTARLASLGEIAAGIAHEMKQPLNVISITADLIKLLHRNGNLNDQLLVSNLEKIRATVDRMAATINHLRGFTRIDSANFRPLQVKELFEGALSIVGEQIRLDDIDVVQEIDEGLPPVIGELNQLEQVLVNLLQNARDAVMDRDPSAENGAAHPRLISLRARAANDKSEVYLEVCDTGVGMTEEIKERLFEPFYTTKDAERGTGLGLSISMNIVQSHSGMIEAESTPGLGSTFRIVLPAAMAAGM